MSRKNESTVSVDDQSSSVQSSDRRSKDRFTSFVFASNRYVPVKYCLPYGTFTTEACTDLLEKGKERTERKRKTELLLY